MKYFIESLEFDDTAVQASCWVPVDYHIKPLEQVALITYHGYLDESVLNMEGKKAIPKAKIQYRIENWVEKSEVEGEPDIEHNDFDTLVQNGLDAAFDDALINHAQNIATDTRLANAVVKSL